MHRKFKFSQKSQAFAKQPGGQPLARTYYSERFARSSEPGQCNLGAFAALAGAILRSLLEPSGLMFDTCWNSFGSVLKPKLRIFHPGCLKGVALEMNSHVGIDFRSLLAQISICQRLRLRSLLGLESSIAALFLTSGESRAVFAIDLLAV